MREFGKTPRKLWAMFFIKTFFTVVFYELKAFIERGFGGHYERIESRRRKTMFHRWRK